MRIIAFFGTARAFDYFVREKLEEILAPQAAVRWSRGQRCWIGDELLLLHVWDSQSLRGYRGKVEVVVSETYVGNTERQRRDYFECMEYIRHMNFIEEG